MMKRFVLCIVCVIALMTPSERGFAAPPDEVPSPIHQLDGLKTRIQENDPNVQNTFSELHAFFTAHPDNFEHSRFLNIKSYFYVLKQDYGPAYEALLEARKYAN